MPVRKNAQRCKRTNAPYGKVAVKCARKGDGSLKLLACAQEDNGIRADETLNAHEQHFVLQREPVGQPVAACETQV